MEQAQQNLVERSSNQIKKISSKNKKIGLFLLIGPIIGLIAIFIIYAIVNFIGSSMGSTVESPLLAISIITVILSFLGIICVLGVIIGIPLGIIFLLKKK
ncbi:MAG: hypothetical protein WCV92_04395 [Candidatus Buchananbacteria bacterium]